MIDLLQIAVFNAAYADAIDSDDLERWPSFFTAECNYRVTSIENYRAGLAAGLVWADTRDMLTDRVSALREANIYERHTYRHLIGIPLITEASDSTAQARTPFMVARIMHTGETDVFATGVYLDRFIRQDGQLLLSERIAVCDSSVVDTLLALPL
ncbi:aromatic-ring-hydroxylating dioxygenase subunit beta [Tepidicella baoligensis]|uniref:aromatic-ring-hydroxylating dioxygenase subunit beta n=1 Tax=Tepidicella baoligensis TaxID=2707016 RepID=UPI0015D9D49B|nr:nuclear transport factor 2 family protein [Tepidicella baoligensis]